MNIPPLTLSVKPVTYEPSSDAKNRMVFATSTGSATRPSTICAVRSGWFVVMSVAATPGAIALTVILWGPRARARDFVRHMTPALEAEYGADATSPPT